MLHTKNRDVLTEGLLVTRKNKKEMLLKQLKIELNGINTFCIYKGTLRPNKNTST